MEVISSEPGTDNFAWLIEQWEKTPRAKLHAESNARVRVALHDDRRVTSWGALEGSTQGGNFKMIGRIPPEVSGFIDQFYAKECGKKSFWEWFFRKYPQFRLKRG